MAAHKHRTVRSKDRENLCLVVCLFHNLHPSAVEFLILIGQFSLMLFNVPLQQL